VNVKSKQCLCVKRIAQLEATTARQSVSLSAVSWNGTVNKRRRARNEASTIKGRDVCIIHYFFCFGV
jgi:hypothetical protein